MRLLTLLSVLLLLGCEMPMAEIRELPEPPTLEVPVMIKATVDKEWVSLKPHKGFSIYVGVTKEFSVSSGIKKPLGLQVSGGDGISVVQSSPGIYEVSSQIVGLGYIQLDYDSINTINYPVMVHPVPAPIAVLGEWGNQGILKRENITLPLWVSLQPVPGLEKDHCEILSFSMERISRIGLREISGFNSSTPKNRLVEKIKSLEANDLLLFDGIRARCKGDVRVRLLNPMVFTIK
ncbi:hypothetical protein [Neolewinella agarilytica]|uniref:hypothetical protein n=1 Tax=Neolewinella agarilytica TaxID=478744 RepID=UPI002357E422|nr:hypothetical protein [Neolewinella agarilytica]